jgi:hypothetical protein
VGLGVVDLAGLVDLVVADRAAERYVLLTFVKISLSFESTSDSVVSASASVGFNLLIGKGNTFETTGMYEASSDNSICNYNRLLPTL